MMGRLREAKRLLCSIMAAARCSYYTGDHFIGFHDVFSPADRINSTDRISTNEITGRPGPSYIVPRDITRRHRLMVTLLIPRPTLGQPSMDKTFASYAFFDSVNFVQNFSFLLLFSKDLFIIIRGFRISYFENLKCGSS